MVTVATRETDNHFTIVIGYGVGAKWEALS